MPRKTHGFVFTALLLSAGAAQATDMTMSYFLDWNAKKDPASKATLQTYMTGLMDGIRWQYTFTPRESRPYCPPANLPFSGALVQQMVLGAKDRYPGDKEVGEVILHELRLAFPCKL